VTFINFGAGKRRNPRREGAVPGESEQPVGLAAAQAMGAFPAHARGASGFADAAGAPQRLEKGELTLGTPAVPSTRRKAVATEFRFGVGLVHPPAWITFGVL
jgi:hypothetical protein